MRNISDAHISFRVSPALDNNVLNELFGAAWPNHQWKDFQPVLEHSLAYICAFAEDRLIGFVNLAWDGGIHAFLLDTTVHPQWQRRGVGRELARRSVIAAQEQGIHWLHVDYEPHLEHFYRACGFQPTLAGLIELAQASQKKEP